MHSAIVVIEMPEAPYNSAINQTWQTFLAVVDRAAAHQPDPLAKQDGLSLHDAIAKLIEIGLKAKTQ